MAALAEAIDSAARAEGILSARYIFDFPRERFDNNRKTEKTIVGRALRAIRIDAEQDCRGFGDELLWYADEGIEEDLSAPR